MKRLVLGLALALALLVANKPKTIDTTMRDWPPTCFPPRCH